MEIMATDLYTTFQIWEGFNIEKFVKLIDDGTEHFVLVNMG